MSWVRARWIELACLGLGLGLLTGIVWHVGVETLVRDLGVLGWGLLLILTVESLAVTCNTSGWLLAFPAGERTIRPGRLFAVRLAGDGVNYLTPSGSVGGELLRIRLLGGGMPLGVRWASVSVAKIGQTVAQAVFVLLGLALVLPRLTHTAPWVTWVLAGSIATGVSVAFAWLLSRGIWRTFATVVRGIGLRRWLPGSWAGPGQDLDAALGRLGGWRLTGSLACFLGGWTVGAAEIYLILTWLGGPVDWQTALAVETGSVFIDGVFFFVPAKLGTQEGGKVVLFAALGLNPARGLTVGVVRRIRELTYAGLGMAALGWLTARRGPALHAAVAPPAEWRR